MFADTAEFYKRVSELMSDERPSEEIIENDSQLDAYLADLERKRATPSK